MGKRLKCPAYKADNAPPDGPDPPGERVGEHVKVLAKVLSDLVEDKLNARASIHGLMRLAVAACTADVVT